MLKVRYCTHSINDKTRESLSMLFRDIMQGQMNFNSLPSTKVMFFSRKQCCHAHNLIFTPIFCLGHFQGNIHKVLPISQNAQFLEEHYMLNNHFYVSGVLVPPLWPTVNLSQRSLPRQSFWSFEDNCYCSSQINICKKIHQKMSMPYQKNIYC